MEVPAMAVGGVTPVLSPLVVLFLVLALLGAALLLLALLRRNWRLLVRERLNPFRLADMQKAANPRFGRPAGAPAFHATAYGRAALILTGIGVSGLALVWLWALFSG